MPGIERAAFSLNSLNLEFEQATGLEQAVYLVNIAFNYLAARNVLEHKIGIREIELRRRHCCQIEPVILIDVCVGISDQRFPRPHDHFTTNIYCVNLAK